MRYRKNVHYVEVISFYSRFYAFRSRLVTKAHTSFMTYKSFKILHRRQKRERRNMKTSLRHFSFSVHFDRRISIFTRDLAVCHCISIAKFFYQFCNNYLSFSRFTHKIIFEMYFREITFVSNSFPLIKKTIIPFLRFTLKFTDH